MGSSSKQKSPPIRLVLFDVFDTLCTPRLPVHEQYHEEALRAGIPSETISPDTVRAGFKPAFKEMDKTWPMYGKHADPPLMPEKWWTELIRRCIVNAGAEPSLVDHALPRLGPSLLKRFESEAGYRNFPETLDTLDELGRLGVKVSVVSNADPRILHTLSALDILPRLSHPPTLSWDVESSKPDRAIYDAACRLCQETPGLGVVMIGDELRADYHGSVAAGLEGRLIRRQGEWSDGAQRTANEDLEGVSVLRSLSEIVEEVRSRQAE
ncbi:HAD-like domain-containing protein [Papiliotrema laurentii]|uniref:HAD-like domain-containing protein n=1 Tax=Papiliotrema laurentii TaxID=5418 RepID=A0AAD9CZI7_PAPLA|nr:HAD-like domain-containing protein [Papiliotrema laurentii]